MSGKIIVVSRIFHWKIRCPLISTNQNKVTGANKGIGYAIVRGLAQQLTGSVIYLTGGYNFMRPWSIFTRTCENGCSQESHAWPGSPAETRGGTWPQEDQRSPVPSIGHHGMAKLHEAGRTFAAKTRWPGCTHQRLTMIMIKILINNAGFAFKNDATEPAGVQADVSVAINYYGTKQASLNLKRT